MSTFVRLCCFPIVYFCFTGLALQAQLPATENIAPGTSSPVVADQAGVISQAIPDATTIAPASKEASTPTSAMLRVHVADGATVIIDGHITKTQKYSGGSRLFTLTGLDPWQPTNVVVEARLEHMAVPISYATAVEVQPGKSHKVKFDLVPVVTRTFVQNDGELIDAAEKLERASLALTGAAERLETAAATLDKANTGLSNDLTSAHKQFHQKLEAAKMQFGDELEAAKQQFATDNQGNLVKTKALLDDYSTQVKAQIKTSIGESLTDSEMKLSELTTNAESKIGSLVTGLENAAGPFLADGAPIAGPPAKRIYKLESAHPLEATLSYNEDKEIGDIHFVESSLTDNTITFVDANQWNAAEVATGGELKLQLAVRYQDADGNAKQKPFLPDETLTVAVKFDSFDNRSAKLPLMTGNKNLKDWVETTIHANADQAEKLTLDDQVSAILVTGEFTLGFADPVKLSDEQEKQVLEIKVLR